MGTIVERLSDFYPKATIASSLDALKNLCYRFASQSGLTVSIDDVKTPAKKREILDSFEDQADKVETQFRRGVITDGERRQQEVRIWTEATTQVQQAMEAEFAAQRFNPIDMMVGSGARGNMTQMRQIAGMRGLVANPRGDMIPRPIKKNFREGLETLEYFIATPGARKGLVDTALRTADSGYLTRRLVDVAQELIIREEDCGTTLGIWVENVRPDSATAKSYLDTSLFGRALLRDVKLADGTVSPRNTIVGEGEMAQLRDDPEVDRVQVRSVLACDAELGVCAACYGRSLATGKSIELGEAVGVIAAQSIGEPGTQLTMRTFHTGGVAGKDIAGGLPRVVELFEARTPRGSARLAAASGVVRLGDDEGKGIPVSIVDDEGDEHPMILPVGVRPIVTDGQEVTAGDPITDGPFDPKDLIMIKGIRETQHYLVEQVQKVYREQGVSIHDKHIELIVRQMTRRVGVQEPGDAGFLPGERVDAKVFRDTNRRMVEESQRPAEGRPEIMGITKASLATESWLSAASFQETTRVLTEAAIDGKCRQPHRPQGEHHHRQADPGRDRHGQVPGVRHRSPRLRADDVLLHRRRGRRPRRLAVEHPRHLRRRRGPRRARRGRHHQLTPRPRQPMGVSGDGTVPETPIGCVSGEEIAGRCRSAGAAFVVGVGAGTGPAHRKGTPQ